MTRPRRSNRLRRGQPLIALALLLSAWVGARAVLQDSFSAPAPEPSSVVRAGPEPVAPPAMAATAPPASVAETSVVRVRPAAPRPFVTAPQAAPDFERLRQAEEHQLLWLSAVAPGAEPAGQSISMPAVTEVAE